jgi:immunoglobulin-binding protein 1
MEYSNMIINNNKDEAAAVATGLLSVAPPPSSRREDKIARYQAKLLAKQEMQRLQGLRDRRTRLGVASQERMDDMDEEMVDRSLAMTNLRIAKVEAFEEWMATLREIPMILERIQREQQDQQLHSHNNNNNDNSHDPRQPSQPSSRGPGLSLTHITLDGTTNQLQFRREEIKSQVFRQGWNPPTMTLAELGDRERAEAIEREQRQNEAEIYRAEHGPRRYDQLYRDGMEDQTDRVDASAVLDRAWDDWKDENPRGSGNKRGDQGDRNF